MYIPNFGENFKTESKGDMLLIYLRKSQIVFLILNTFKVIQNRHQRERGFVSCIRHLYYRSIDRVRVKARKVALYDLSGPHLVGNGFINVFRCPLLQAGELWLRHGAFLCLNASARSACTCLERRYRSKKFPRKDEDFTADDWPVRYSRPFPPIVQCVFHAFPVVWHSKSIPG
jgi:hypothetical protein